MWGRYRVTQGRLVSLMLAAGVVSVSRQYTARNNAVALPGYTRLDASTSYELAGPKLTLALVAQNLTNRRYATSGTGTTFVVAPLRRVAVQLTSAF
jgi:outer membrane receptor protein involved in Fe transport